MEGTIRAEVTPYFVWLSSRISIGLINHIVVRISVISGYFE